MSVKQSKNTMLSVTVVIPAYNNSGTIEQVIRDALHTCMTCNVDFEIFVIDDCGKDGTREILKSLENRIPELRVFYRDKNVGFGGFFDLYKMARKDIVFFTPADGQMCVRELPGFLEHTDADIVLGYRPKRKDPFRRIVISKAYNILISIIARQRIQEINCMKLVRRSCVKNLRIEGKTAFVDAEMIIRALRNGACLKQIPIAAFHSDKVGGGGRFSVLKATLFDMLKIGPKLFWLPTRDKKA